MKTARVLITTECNLKCEYCCNKLPEIQESFKMTTMDQFVKMDYDVVNISGGEPMKNVEKIDSLVYALDKADNNATLYLYTNGYESYEGDIHHIASLIDGVNIGCHGDFDKSFLAALTWAEFCGNVRFHIQEGRIAEDEKISLLISGIELKEWKMNECENTPEDRWII